VNEFLEPGMRVIHPTRPDWGTGQVQSRIGTRITVNFEHAGKVVFIGDSVTLRLETAANARPEPGTEKL